MNRLAIHTLNPHEVRAGDQLVGLRSIVDNVTFADGSATFWANRCPLKRVGRNETVQVLRPIPKRDISPLFDIKEKV